MEHDVARPSEERAQISPCDCTAYNGDQCYNCLNAAHRICETGCNRSKFIVSKKETTEHERLLRLWARGKATAKQVARCMELDRKAAA